MRTARLPRALPALVVLLLSVAAPARAGTRVFIGGVVGFPAPYPYAPYYYPYYPAPYPWATYPEVPPPGWVPGRWEWRSDPWGQRYPAWIPPHLE